MLKRLRDLLMKDFHTTTPIEIPDHKAGLRFHSKGHMSNGTSYYVQSNPTLLASVTAERCRRSCIKEANILSWS